MAEKVTVLTEGIIEVTLNQSGLNLIEICEKEKEDVDSFKQGLADGYATGVVSLSNGTRGKIDLRIEGVMQISDDFRKNNASNIPHIQPGEDYYQNAFLRIFVFISNFVASKENTWIIWGHINNKTSETTIPISIVYSVILQKCFYSIKRKTDILSSDSTMPGFSAN